MKWMAMSNWLFSLIWDQSGPYELWFWLKGKLRGMATSFPKFTTRFKPLKRVVSSSLYALVMSVCCPLRLQLLLVFLAALSGTQ